jgi:hypothetical protein
MSDEYRDDPGEEARLGRLLAERLPRHAAPAGLREAVQALAAPPRRGAWWAPAVSALATALALVLLALPLLPRPAPPDPLQPFLGAVLSAHARILLWGEPRPEAAAAALPRVMEATGVGLAWFFQGDDALPLVGAEALVVEGRRTLALVYREPVGHTVTYLVLPGAGIRVPERGRVQVGRFRPHLRRLDGFSLFAWKQGELACFLVSDLVSEDDLARFKELFLKVRLAAEPRSW